MEIRDPFSVLCGLFFIPIVAWFYPHCARPSLQWARGKPVAFTVAALSSAAGIAAGGMMLVEGFVGLSREMLTASLLLALLWLPAALSYLRPAWIIRLTGGPAHA